MIRLKDIAAQAGVSVMTVSKALRDAPDIAAATKERIRALSIRMGYVRDAAAASMRSHETRLLGLIVPALTNPVFARIIMAIEEGAAQEGFDLLIAQTLNQTAIEERAIRRMISRRVQGVFISPVYRHEPNAPAYAELARLGVHTVILGQRPAFCQGLPSVETDDVRGSLQITRHLLSLGHRRIAFFAGSPVSPPCQERFEGYQRGLREAGLEVDDSLVFSAGSTIEEGEKAALQMLNELPDVTAVQAVNDLVAIGAATIFLRQGVRIPDDLSITGFGNILTAEHFRVPLTTARQPKFRMGTTAMESMIRLLRGARLGARRLPAEIVIRASAAAPPAGRRPTADLEPARNLQLP